MVWASTGKGLPSAVMTVCFTAISIACAAPFARSSTSQWFHSDVRLHYARWKNGHNQGEVDIVNLDNAKHKPHWAVEVKWSDRFFDRPYELENLISFCKANMLGDATVTTISKQGIKTQDNVALEFTPASLYCYQLGYNIIRFKKPPTAKQVVANDSR